MRTNMTIVLFKELWFITQELHPFSCFEIFCSMHGYKLDMGMVDSSSLHNETNPTDIWKIVFKNCCHFLCCKNKVLKYIVRKSKNITWIVFLWNNNSKSLSIWENGKKRHIILIFPNNSCLKSAIRYDFTKDTFSFWSIRCIFWRGWFHKIKNTRNKLSCASVRFWFERCHRGCTWLYFGDGDSRLRMVLVGFRCSSMSSRVLTAQSLFLDLILWGNERKSKKLRKIPSF